MDYSDVFISYRRKDVEFVKQLDTAFKAHGREVWIDWEDIPPGSEGFSADIKRGIEGADAFIAVLSPDYLDSTYCVDMELGYALQLKKKIIPLVYRKFEDRPVPDGIGHINWVYFTPHAGQENVFDEAFQRVIQAMETDLDHVRAHTRLLLRAQEWEENNQQRSFLLDGVEVVEAEEWLTQAVNKDPAPTKLHSAYIHESRKAETRRQRILMGVASVAMIILTVLAIVAVFLWIDASRQRENAENNLILAQTSEARAVANALTATIAQGQAEASAEEAQSLLWTSFAEQALDNSENPVAIALALEANSVHNPPVLAEQMLAEVAYAPGARHVFTQHRDRIVDAGFDATQADPFAVYAVDFNADATRAYSIGADLTLFVWDLDPSSVNFNQPIANFSLPYPTDTFVFRQDLTNQMGRQSIPFEVSPDGRFGVIYRANTDSEQSYADVFILEPTSPAFGSRIIEVPSTNTSPFVGFNVDSGTILISQCIQPDSVVCAQSELTEWSPATDRVVRTLQGSWGEIIGFNSTSQIIVTVDNMEDGIMRLYSLTDGAFLRELDGNLRYVGGGQFNADGHLFMASVFDSSAPDNAGNSVALWDVETGNVLQHYRSSSPMSATQVAFSPDNRQVMALRAGQGGVEITFYNLVFGWALRTMTINLGYVDNARFSDDGQRVLIGSRRGEVQIWDVYNGIEARRWTYAVPRINNYVLNGDGRLALMSTEDGQMVLWDRVADTEVTRYTDFPHQIIGFLPDNTALLSSSIENRVWLWNPMTGEDIRTLITSDLVTGWTFVLSHDGTQFLTADNTTITLWDTSTGAEIRTFTGFDGQFMQMAFSPDDRMIVVTGFGGQADVMLWETTTGTSLHRFILPIAGTMQRTGFNPVVFTPDSAYVIVGGRDGRLYLWDIIDSEEVTRYQFVHNHAVTALAISPDGQYLVTGDFMGNVHIFEVATGFELRHYIADEGAAHEIIFSADGMTTILNFGENDNPVRTANQLPAYVPDFLADDIGSWDTIEIYVHPALSDLQAWIDLNRIQHEFTCPEREQFRILPLCDEFESTLAATQNSTPTATEIVVTETPAPTSATSGQNQQVRSPQAVIGQNAGTLDNQSHAVWRYLGRAGEVLTITIDASFVSNIVLFDPITREVIAEYDTNTGGDVPRIDRATLAQDGEVIIEITSVEPNPRDEYILVIESE